MSLLLALTGTSGGAFTLNADSGSYAISGTAATLLKNSVVDAASGAYLIAGTDATLLRNKVLPGDSGEYLINGTDATFVYTPGAGAYTLNADSGAYSIAGTDAAFVYVPNDFTDTHDGYWTKQWLSRRKKPKIAEVIEFVKEQPQEAIAEVAQEVKKVYPQIDYREIANNVRLQKFIAEQLLQALKNRQDDEDMMDFMMML